MACEGQQWLRCGPVPVDRLLLGRQALGPCPLSHGLCPVWCIRVTSREIRWSHSRVPPCFGEEGAQTSCVESAAPAACQDRVVARPLAAYPRCLQLPHPASQHPLLLGSHAVTGTGEWHSPAGASLVTEVLMFCSQSAHGFQLWFQTHLGASFSTCPFTPCCGPRGCHAACVCWESCFRKCRWGGSWQLMAGLLLPMQWGWSSARLWGHPLWLSAPPGPVRQQRTP